MKLLMCTAMIGAALFAGAPLAHANEDPNANPPNCSAADLEFARAGVQQATADYLVDHPDVNNFYNSLEGLTRDQAKPKVAGLHEVAPADEGRPYRYPAAADGHQEPLRQPRTSAALATVGDHPPVHHAITLDVGVIGAVHDRAVVPDDHVARPPLVAVDVVLAGGVIEQI